MNLTRLLNIEHPVVQAPMYGVTTPEMVTAASNTGCLGSLPLGDLPAEKCREIIRTTKQLSGRPFATNLFVNEVPELTIELREKYALTKLFIEGLAKQYDMEVALPGIDELEIGTYHDQIDAVLDSDCKIVSFTFGNLDKPAIRKFKSNNVVLIGTCTSVAEAVLLEQSGIDVICVQGIEAGGHRGAFGSDYIPQIGGLSLLAQVSGTVKVPLIYAGGIYNAKTFQAAKALGAQAVQVGSMLIGSAESALKDFEKQRLTTVKETDIVLTRSFSGRYARGIKNFFTESLDNSDYILPYPYQNKLTGELRKLAKARANVDFVSIWLGQSITGYSRRSTSEILTGLINEIGNV
ncbi:putative monooxygenase [Flavihumibacter petaseus NBRC 106054]|uniref:Propionate 3-nitronate monooxygenase n=2 Tax=Flavihumibacter TaxID=1004301 RepID=A0A0E9MYU5_9BACT|nr:putative monooxygenase [Flavihumibacter petaseus NBRC 106054]